MKRLLLALALTGVFVACNENQPQEEVLNQVEETATEMPVLALATFDADAASHVDSEVMISGLVDHVCKHGGKKLLLVSNDATVHVESETRFEDALIGQEVSLIGIVREERIDESSCLSMEEDNIKKHKEGETDEENFKHKQDMIQSYRDSMATAGIDHLSYYSLEFVSFKED